MERIARMPAADRYAAANSYFGLARQATHSHTDRCSLANLMRERGYAVDRTFTKVFRGKHGR